MAESENLPLKFAQVKNETELQNTALDAVDNGFDLIFAISEFPDYNGHSYGFGPTDYRYVSSVTNADRYAYNLIEHIEARSEFENEDWLYIITSDHGGHARRHGTQDERDRMTFIALNKKIQKYEKRAVSLLKRRVCLFKMSNDMICSFLENSNFSTHEQEYLLVQGKRQRRCNRNRF